MPQASTKEFLLKLHDLIDEYSGRVSVAEMIGALECKKLEFFVLFHESEDDEDTEGEEWKGAGE